ncbi:hypothetical protein Thein_1584 [Thermodesulfatator indicus DSM 15286]|uniref:Uncharacterized protein n=1 Tax=Thermodesulfatator indicus (strain DSM 15286 / JCM 11887 / CIR29812) TaxID=667014 RepID=F8AAT3_THEID|nr:hypothetical protein [Thermodesulfatator indicus]AEH45444.1 hypothetical protein Thein_1584 [Thermodesulfatator indicus DSM 15286]
MNKEIFHQLLPKAACGHLIQGLIHNFSGPLQIISMQLEMLKFSLSKEPENELSKTLRERLSQMEEQIVRLKDLLDAACVLTQNSPTPININDVLKRMLIFWEADLKFKHDIPKNLFFSQDELMIIAPPAQVYQGFCALFWAIVPFLVKNKFPLTVKTQHENVPVIDIEINGSESLPEDDPFFVFARETLSPFFNFEVSKNRLRLVFNPS